MKRLQLFDEIGLHDGSPNSTGLFVAVLRLGGFMDPPLVLQQPPFKKSRLRGQRHPQPRVKKETCWEMRCCSGPDGRFLRRGGHLARFCFVRSTLFFLLHSQGRRGVLNAIAKDS